jgi:uncharacterized protein, YfiH family
MFYSKRLKKFKEIKHCFFSRKGGLSSGMYRSLNCGRGSNDKKENVKKNLMIVTNKMKFNKNNIILMHQTHSNKVIEIRKSNLRKNINSDAMFTKEKGVLLGVVTADCVPILIYDKKKRTVGCIHAGWKGALSGIIKNTILAIRKSDPEKKIYASIGPCIGKMNYEVDTNFYKKFLQRSKRNKVYFSKKNKRKKIFNLRRFVADRLLELNVYIDHVNRDAFKEKNNFFSYRRSFKLKQNDYGRCISVIGLI